MTYSKNKLKKLLLNNWPIGVIVILVLIFFYPVWLQGLVPLPADFIVGTYYPWLDYNWGYEVGVPVKNPITSDVVSVIYPLRSMAVDLIKSGTLPLWNSRMFTGYPLLANFQVGVFSPTMLFYFIMPKIWAWSAQVMVQPPIAAIGMYLFLRNIKLGKLASLTGGLAYAFAGFSVIWLEWNAHALVAAWIPYVFLFGDKFVKTSKYKWGVLMSLVICLQIFSGYPQVVLYTIGAFALYLLFIKKYVDYKKATVLITFVLLGLLLSSILVVPALELYFISQRGNEFLDPDLVFFPWQNLVTFFAPDYFGNPATGNYFGIGNYTLNTGYTGIVAIYLSIVGYVRFKNRPEVKYFFIIIILSLIYVLPTPISRLLSSHNLLGMSALSPTRVFILVNFSLASLSAFGIQGLINSKKKADLLAYIFPAAIILSMGVATFLVAHYLTINTDYHNQTKVSLRNLILPSIIITLTFFVLLLRDKHSKVKALNYFLIVTICFLLIAELFRYSWKYTPFSAPELVFPETPIISYLRNQEKPFRVYFGDSIPMNMWVPYGIESLSGYDAVYPTLWSKFNGVISNNDVNSSGSTRYADFISIESRWFDLLNSKYLVAVKRNDKAIPDENGLPFYKYRLDKFKNVFEDRSVVIMENSQVYPRAFIVGKWVEKTTENEMLETLINDNFYPTRSVILSESFNSFNQENADSKSEVKYLEYEDQKSKLLVRSEKPGLLFISELWYPGWKVFVDNREHEIMRANYSFRAVPIPQGQHEVLFIYDPKSFKIGKWLSLIAATFLVAVYIYERKYKDSK